MGIEKYYQYNHIPYDFNDGKFIWGPGEYPKNGDDSYEYWD